MIPKKVQKVLEQHNLKAIEFEAGSTSTSYSAAEKLSVPVGQIAKSILLAGKNGLFYMVVCSGDKKLSNSKLKKLLGVKTRMATAEETKRITDFEPGGVCPFGVKGVVIFIDRSLEQYDTVYPAAGTDSSGVPMTFEELTQIAGNAVCDVTV
jgi:prolyl-tRNA editing enzyme YbaK/EbsC (Cys-tRNA(Pro) deacylase)